MVIARKSSLTVLGRLLEELHSFLHRLPSAPRREEEKARVHIVTAMAQMPAESSEDDDASKEFAHGLGDWLVQDLE